LARIKTKNLELGYEVAGNGPPIIFISGLGYGRWLWENQIEGLKDDFTVYALDNRGIGESESPESPYSVAAMARDVRDFMEAMNISKASLVGSSLGGFVAQVFALENPEKVERLGLVSTTGGGEGSKFSSPWTMFKLVLAGKKKSPEQRARARLKLTVGRGFWEQADKIEELLQKFLEQKFTSHGIEAQTKAGQDFWRKDHRWTDLYRIKAETLVITGDEDRIVPSENSKNLAKAIPQASLEIMKGAGHLVMLEQPDKFNDLIYTFFKTS